MPTRILCVFSMLLLAVLCSAQTSPSASSVPKEIPSFDLTAIELRPGRTSEDEPHAAVEPEALTASLFSGLAKYAASDNTSPLENFTTELLAWMVNAFPFFGRSLSGLFTGESIPEHAAVVAQTQVGIRGGFIDLQLSLHRPTAPTVYLLVENKIESGLGIRGPLPGDSPGSESAQDERAVRTQLDRYLHFAASQPEDYRVLLLSKRPIRYEPRAHRERWAGLWRWHDVQYLLDQVANDPVLRRLGARSEQVFGFVSSDLRQFMREYDMVFDPVRPGLLLGTPERVRLVKLLEEVGEEVCRGLGDFDVTVGTTSIDRWGVWVYLRRSMENFAGICYSDGKGEAFLGLVDRHSRDRDLLLRLKAHPQLLSLREPRAKDYWGAATIRFQCFGEDFLNLSAKDQLGTLSTECAEYLRAILPTIIDARPEAF